MSITMFWQLHNYKTNIVVGKNAYKCPHRSFVPRQRLVYIYFSSAILGSFKYLVNNILRYENICDTLLLPVRSYINSPGRFFYTNTD